MLRKARLTLVMSVQVMHICLFRKVPEIALMARRERMGQYLIAYVWSRSIISS